MQSIGGKGDSHKKEDNVGGKIRVNEEEFTGYYDKDLKKSLAA